MNKVIGGRYKLEKKIGKGGMGDVFYAKDTKDDKEVAIKQIVIPENANNAKKLLERFKREYLFLSAINHPNIVKAYDFLEEQGNFFLVLEFIRGFSLQTFIKKRPQIPLAQQLAIAIQIASSVEVINTAGIIHRDIKPANIMIPKQAGQIKILDLGIAKSIKDEQAHLTKEGAAMGTPEYMSPEQVYGEVAPNSDVFSLGVTLYQFFLWQKSSPFKRPGIMASMMAITNEEIPMLDQQIDFAVPPQEREVYQKLAQVFGEATAKEPEERIVKASLLSRKLRGIYNELQDTISALPENDWRPTCQLDSNEISKLQELGKKYGSDNKKQNISVRSLRQRRGNRFGHTGKTKTVQPTGRMRVVRQQKTDKITPVIIIITCIISAFLLIQWNQNQNQLKNTKQTLTNINNQITTIEDSNKKLALKISQIRTKIAANSQQTKTVKKEISVLKKQLEKTQ